MTPTLYEIAAADRTAVLTCEMQRAIVGDLAVIPVLRDEVAAAGLVDKIVTLVEAAREANVRVVHNTYGARGDLAGLALNTHQVRRAVRNKAGMIVDGEASAELIPELGPEPSDIVVHRIHGYTPFTGTALDSVLRNMKVSTVIPVGVSLNECVLGTCLSAADLGYEIVIPADAVVGVPRQYGEQVLKFSLAAIATITTVSDIVNSWGSGKVEGRNAL